MMREKVVNRHRKITSARLLHPSVDYVERLVVMLLLWAGAHQRTQHKFAGEMVEENFKFMSNNCLRADKLGSRRKICEVKQT